MHGNESIGCKIRVRKLGFDGKPKWDDIVEHHSDVHSLWMYKFEKPSEDKYVADAEPWNDGFMLSILDENSYQLKRGHCKEMNPKTKKEIPDYSISALYMNIMAYETEVVAAEKTWFNIVVDGNFYGPYQKIRVGPYFTHHKPSKDRMFEDSLLLPVEEKIKRQPTRTATRTGTMSPDQKRFEAAQRAREKQDRKLQRKRQKERQERKPFYVPVKTFVDLSSCLGSESM